MNYYFELALINTGMLIKKKIGKFPGRINL